MKAQYEMKQQWEQENFIGNNFGETTAAQKIELESLSNEKNALSESIKKLQVRYTAINSIIHSYRTLTSSHYSFVRY